MGDDSTPGGVSTLDTTLSEDELLHVNADFGWHCVCRSVVRRLDRELLQARQERDRACQVRIECRNFFVTQIQRAERERDAERVKVAVLTGIAALYRQSHDGCLQYFALTGGLIDDRRCDVCRAFEEDSRPVTVTEEQHGE